MKLSLYVIRDYEYEKLRCENCMYSIFSSAEIKESDILGQVAYFRCSLCHVLSAYHVRRHEFLLGVINSSAAEEKGGV